MIFEQDSVHIYTLLFCCVFPTYADNYGYATLREQESNRIAADAGVAIGNRK
ncbi:MAG: hypothetical protein V7K42_21645 [Nostoc sp.]